MFSIFWIVELVWEYRILVDLAIVELYGKMMGRFFVIHMNLSVFRTYSLHGIRRIRNGWGIKKQTGIVEIQEYECIGLNSL